MDPTNRGSEEFRDDESASATDGGRRRPPREGGLPAPETAGGPVRVVQLVAGDYLLTVNPVDGSEIEPCPPGAQPSRSRRHDPDERAELRRAATPPRPARPAGPEIPLLHRDEERERLARLISRGRSVRLTGPSGSGRSALLDAVAEDCEDLAPDGVVRLSGHHRTPTDVLYELFAAVHHAPLHRPDRAAMLAAVHDIGAVVVLDDLEFGGSTLDELLDATPECAFLLAATPDVAAPSADSHLEEVFLGGLDRTSCLELLERAVDRPLTDEEAGWAADLWFESEGLPLRFVQAGALLRQRDALAAAPAAVDEFGVFAERPYRAEDATEDPAEVQDVPLPTLAQAAAPAALLASRLGEAARDTLRFAVALGGELPHQAHLPALAGDTHADAVVGELLACGLISAVGSHYRLAAGVADQLLAQDYGDEAVARAHSAAQHYAWWAGHPSVTPERIAVEADAILAALAVLVADEDSGHRAAAVLLARTAAPAFAAALHWGAWERCLRHGQEAARAAGEVGEEAYFHHELGVLALCTGHVDRARAELEASIGLRGVLADKRGAVAGRRALALVADRSGLALGARRLPGQTPPRPLAGAGDKTPPLPPLPAPRADRSTSAGEEVPDARSEESAAPPAKAPASFAARQPAGNATTVVNRVPAASAVPPARPAPARVPAPPSGPPAGGPVARQPWVQKLMSGGNRRNLAAAGAGVLLAAVLGTVVTLGAASGGSTGGHSDTVKPGQSASQQDGGDGLTADEPAVGQPGAPQVPARKARPGETPRPGGSPGAPGGTTAPSPSASPSGGSATRSPSPDRPSPSPSRTSGGESPKPSPKPTPTKTGGDKPSDSPKPPTTAPSQPPTSGSSNSASGPAPGRTTTGAPAPGTPVA
ncbi:AAA family ATPase [Streptomyces cinnamoneus]|uniref:AAA family ATPase n=1 Tax=Streptomyces cinnamoneus TaxID=53446 RepID=A0A2G1XD86_STRCJ|nr:orc1/cdc6 family replication initiation protein [Streptomyces cinnamoneus]PHQ49196.1 AAA family ATPase [Streptomyces cinnamoneus]PPT15154.1 ATP-binding protein [Streptomyces cinnamoneus]